jgi:YlmC/YmxH family sporulation protein
LLELFIKIRKKRIGQPAFCVYFYEVIAMVCTLTALRNKEVIDMKTGMRLGYVDDIEVDTDTERVVSMIILGRSRAFGIMGKDSDIVIKCSEISLVGEDTILVCQEKESVCTKSRSFTIENLLK